MSGTAPKNTQNGDTKPQGGDGVAAQQDILTAGASDEKPAAKIETEAPVWVIDLINSNDAVVESNQELKAAYEQAKASNDAVVEAVAQFKEHASELIREIIAEAKGLQQDSSGKTPAATLVEIDPDTTYVVAPGKSFQNKDTSLLHVAGDDVSHLEEERLKRLITQGVVIEAFI